MTNFDIELRFKTETHSEVERMAHEVRDRWLTIVKGEFKEFTTTSGKTYNHHIIDVHSIPIDGDGLTLGLARLLEWNHIDNVPVHTRLELDSTDVELSLANDPSLLYDTILHEMGHCLGIDRFFWDRHGLVKKTANGHHELTGENCRAEYQRYAGLSEPTNLPLFHTDGSLHIDEKSFPIEIMSPAMATGRNKLSRLSVAMLADIGYIVDYSNADVFTQTEALIELESVSTGELSKDVCTHSFTDPYASADVS